jgi:uncharacterized protein with HEPN domain
MPHDPKKCLFDIIAACNEIVAFTDGLTIDEFRFNSLVKSGVQMQFIIIGEALARIRATDLGVFNQITQADRIISFRNVIAHGYDVIVDDVVWEIVEDKVPVLLKEAQTLFDK